MPAPVIMVHGAFCGGWVFDRFKAPFEAAGPQCLTPDLPGHGPGEGATVGPEGGGIDRLGVCLPDEHDVLWGTAGLLSLYDNPPGGRTGRRSFATIA